MATKIKTNGQTLIFENRKAQQLQQVYDEVRILHYVLKLLRSTKEGAGLGEYNITAKDGIVALFDVAPEFDNLCKHLKPYGARHLLCYKNAKVRLETMGYMIEESKHVHGDRLVWTITRSRKKKKQK